MDVKTSETHEIYAVDQAKEHFVSEISWAPDNKHLVFVDKIFRQSAVMIVMDSGDTKSAKMLATPNNLSFSPKWSPEGRLLFISFTQSRLLKDRGFYSIWTMNSDGTDQIPFIDSLDGFDVSTPIWSPDGQWIAFTAVANYEGSNAYWDVWIVNRAGTELKRVTANAEKKVNASSVHWSPDGTQLAYGIDHREIGLISLATGDQVNLPIKADEFFIIP